MGEIDVGAFHMLHQWPLPAACPDVIVSGGWLNTEGFRAVSSVYSDLGRVGLEV